MSRLPSDAVSILGSQVTVDAEIIADGLGLTVEALREEMAAGRIAAVAEAGIAEHDGRIRLTFRHGARVWRIQRLADGALVDDPVTETQRSGISEGVDPSRCQKSAS